MWYEHGQTETLYNLTQFTYIEKKDDCVILYGHYGVKVLEFEDEAETCEAYQILRKKVLKFKYGGSCGN